MSGLEINNIRVLCLSVFFLYFYFRKKFKCFLYLHIALLIFFLSFIFFGKSFIDYSGVFLILFSLTGVFFGIKDWSYFRSNSISISDLFLSSTYDKLFSLLMVIILIIPLIFKHIT